VVGRFHDETPEATLREAGVVVDVVIPRRAQPKTLDRLRPYLQQGEFERVEFPVADLPYNNIPELFSGRVLPTTHGFTTEAAGDRFGPFSIRVRRE